MNIRSAGWITEASTSTSTSPAAGSGDATSRTVKTVAGSPRSWKIAARIRPVLEPAATRREREDKSAISRSVRPARPASLAPYGHEPHGRPLDHDSDDLLGSVEDVTEFAFYAYDDLADAVDLQRHAANDVEYMVFLVD